MTVPSFERQREFYDAYWNDSRRFSIDEKCRMRFVMVAVAAFSRTAKKPLRILDVGCGRGWMTNALARYGEVTGVDMSAKEAQKRYPLLRFQEMDIASQFPKETYDVVVSSEVIEHLPRENQAEHIGHISAVLRKGGLLVLTTPNRAQLESLVKRLPDTSHMQPIENWLYRKDLKSMVEPYFSIKRFGSARFYPVFLFSSLLLRAPYHIFYDYCGAYALIDTVLAGTDWGTYSTLVGVKP